MHQQACEANHRAGWVAGAAGEGLSTGDFPIYPQVIAPAAKIVGICSQRKGVPNRT